MYFLSNPVKILISQHYNIIDLQLLGLVQPESEDKRIFSASWVKDTGINQCLRYLPKRFQDLAGILLLRSDLKLYVALNIQLCTFLAIRLRFQSVNAIISLIYYF